MSLTINPCSMNNFLFYFRCCILACYPLEDYFLEKEGIFLLLDLLAVSMIKTVVKQNKKMSLLTLPKLSTTKHYFVIKWAPRIFKCLFWAKSFLEIYIHLPIKGSENHSNEEISLFRTVFLSPWQQKICFMGYFPQQSLKKQYVKC